MKGDGHVGESYLVVVGASAGGIEALERLTRALPEDFRAPVIIVQHVAPNAPSHLADILRRQTRLNVVTIDDRREEELASGSIYLASPGRNIAVRGTRVVGSARLPGHPSPSIDTCFISASESFGDRVVAIILTGMGTDGVAGVRSVKERGGTVLVQEPESAAFPALPAAIPLSHVDYTANLEALAPLLVTLTDGQGDSEISNPDVLTAFLNQLRGRTGIDFRQYKTPTIVRRLSRLMATAGCKTLKEYLGHLTSHPEGYQRLISTFLIKVTEFFRDPALFAYLRENVLPEIVEHARANRSELRLWSAGCATGEEAYTLAIMLAELLGDDADAIPVRIFATDLDADAVAFARRGIYPASALKDMPADLLNKHFTHVDGAFQIKKRIRNLTVFGEYDLGQRAPFPRIDLVLCRNVLIYFTKELQQRTLQLFAFSLRPGGYLVLGKSETTSPLPQYFVPVQTVLKVFQRQGERLLIPAPALADGSSPDRPSPRRVTMSVVPQRRTFSAPPPRWSLVDRLGTFLYDSHLGIVVVDRNYDILTINHAARSMLGIHGQGIGEDLVHLAAVPSSELKAALDAAFRRRAAGTQPRDRASRPRDRRRTLPADLVFSRPHARPRRTGRRRVRARDRRHRDCDARTRARGEQSQVRGDVGTACGAKRRAARTAEVAPRSQRRARERELPTCAAPTSTFLISAEEAEAAAEEVETLNEEMQATSEELETLNEELQATVEELNTTNEELGARSNELERLGRERETELKTAREALTTLRSVVSQTPVPLCLLDKHDKVTIASEDYIALAQRNDGAIPAVGHVWKQRPDSVALAGPSDGATTKWYAVEVLTILKDEAQSMVLLHPQQ